MANPRKRRPTASSLSRRESSATEASEKALSAPAVAYWQRLGTTNVPDDAPPLAAPQTWPALLFLGGKVPVSLVWFVATVGVIAWMFIQDNAAGKLDTTAGILQLLVKCAFAAVALGVVTIVGRMLRR